MFSIGVNISYGCAAFIMFSQRIYQGNKCVYDSLQIFLCGLFYSGVISNLQLIAVIRLSWWLPIYVKLIKNDVEVGQSWLARSSVWAETAWWKKALAGLAHKRRQTLNHNFSSHARRALAVISFTQFLLNRWIEQASILTVVLHHVDFATSDFAQSNS